MIINGYVVPDDLEIEEFQTKKGQKMYACNNQVSLSKDSIYYANAKCRICDCGKETHAPYLLLCPECQEKARREKYLKHEAVKYIGQPVFVDDVFVEEGGLEDYLSELVFPDSGYTWEDIKCFEIFEAVPFSPPEFEMSDFLADYAADQHVTTIYDEAINALIRTAAGTNFTWGKNRVLVPLEWLEPSDS